MKNKIYIIVRNGIGSHYLMGSVLAKYYEGITIDLERDSIDQITNSYIILIKNYIGELYKFESIIQLRQRGNKIIYYVGDMLSTQKDNLLNFLDRYHELYDLVLWPSKSVASQMSSKLNNDFLYHIWDPKIKKSLSQFFSICYCGTVRDSKAFLCPGLNIVDVYGREYVESLGKYYRKAELDYNELSRHNMHYSFRHQNQTEYWFGTNTKLSTAAASNANIVLSRDIVFQELLPEYDYYCDDYDHIETVIEKARIDFGTKKWSKNLQKLSNAKQLTSCESIARRLGKLIANI